MPKSLNSGCLFTDVQHIPGSFKVFVLFLSLCCRDNCSSCFFFDFHSWVMFPTTTFQDATVRHTARIRLEYETNATKSSEATRGVLRFDAIPLIYLISLATIPVRCWISIKYYINILTIYIKLQTYRIILTYMCIQYSIYLSTIINYHHIYDI